jgi:hypothetical protein
MASQIFITSLAVFFILLFTWSFRTLPDEGWQIIASVPIGKVSDNQWKGLNLTFYGFFLASSCVLAAIIGYVLLRAIQIPASAIFILVGSIFAVALPAARLIARIVEGKLHTFTVAGALFAGTLLAPGIIFAINYGFGYEAGTVIPMIPTLAAASIAYAFGEGTGRLACISFGCCYGKPIQFTHPLLKRFFENANFKFLGKTKKAAYEGGFEGIKLVPIQAITAIIYISIGLIGTYLFLKSSFVSATVVTVAGTQLWRSISETLRADYRGKGRGKISDYQIMALVNIIYVAGLLIAFPAKIANTPNVVVGLTALWSPAILIALISLWTVIFLYTGRSSVTGSVLSFQVHRDRI